MRTLLTVILLCIVLNIISAFPRFTEKDERSKRGIEERPDWNDIGWAWGKRSVPNQIPRRLLRAVHAVKKNPTWDDLGWTWGRR